MYYGIYSIVAVVYVDFSVILSLNAAALVDCLEPMT